MRVGIAFGEATEEDGDWFGMPVVRAARLCAAAEVGEILTDRFVAALADHTDATFDNRGELTLKGITDPVPAFGLVGAATGRRVPLPSPLQLPAGSVFVGRTAQLAALRGGVDEDPQANQRRCSSSSSGEPGAGKTSIAACVRPLGARSEGRGGAVRSMRRQRGLRVPTIRTGDRALREARRPANSARPT